MIIKPHICIVLYTLKSTFILIISATLRSKGQVKNLFLKLVLLVFPDWKTLSFLILFKFYLSYMG